ncbi:MAG: GNAT family N-acetyltransferase, partial [Chloroflexi bacterium]|nr:GNAT family N-acetyltransferase [Chloroflexota bacterium]
EVAFSVADEYQRRGIGRYLSQLLVRLARERRIKGFQASVLPENIPMRHIFEREATENESTLHTTYDGGVFSIWFHLGVVMGKGMEESLACSQVEPRTTVVIDGEMMRKTGGE